ncbi:solute carrier family 35 member F6-like [Panulirus ornatus]|uniref:solute carrier family 35 member F6-like n=1 Tax=Panulirus ornatus TaxID=150431 RepID=UPI003A8A0C5B
MTWTKKHTILALAMATTGSVNTIAAKWMDKIESVNRQGNLDNFSHPFFQADAMFVGEMLCMVAFFVPLLMAKRAHRNAPEMAPMPKETKRFPPMIFYLPALCDMTATSMMYLGLTMTYASSFQMLRGAVIVFTGLMSVAFLGRKLKYFHWAGIFTVLAGLVIVGVSDFLGSSESNADINGVITGDLLIVMAQIVVATQMVLEEKFVTKYNVPPMLAVGWEGLFGFLTLTVLMVPMYFIPAGRFSGNERGVLEDAIDAFVQLGNNGLLICGLILNITSIAMFNFSGLSVTKEISATARMVLDSVRTFIIWAFSLAVKWQEFQYLQPIGFVVLLVGLMLYNDLIILPFLRRKGFLQDQPNDIEPVETTTDEIDGVDNDGAQVDPF